MDTSYVGEQMDDILGETFGNLDYRLKYEIVFGYMPRPDYIDELNDIFAFLKNNGITNMGCLKNNYGGLKGVRVKKSKCPPFLQQKDKCFIINGLKIEFMRTGIEAHLSGNINQNYTRDFKQRGHAFQNGYETEDAVIFYKFVYLYVERVIQKQIPDYKKSRKFYIKTLGCVPAEDVYLLLECCFKMVNEFTCKLCKQCYKDVGKTPSKPITKITVKKMTWELIKNDPRKWLLIHHHLNPNMTFTYRSNTEHLLCPKNYPNFPPHYAIAFPIT
jgi:hypothetical protein